jgi:uncharacterized protein
MVKVVIDTNVFISALYLPELRPAEVVRLARKKKLLNFISLAILNEVERIMREKLLLDGPRTKTALKLIQNLSETITPHKYLTVLADDPDNRVLECAVQAQADYIISGDRHLLNLKNYHHIEIVTPSNFLDKFAQ